MSSNNEDSVPTVYKYAWAEGHEMPLQDFLTKFKPSMVQNDGTKPWIWVRGSKPSKEDTGVAAAIEEATKLLKEVTEKVESIKNDDSIPVRSNKKTGARSKKEVREEVQAQATEQLKAIATKHGYVSGKWLIFAPQDKIDLVWSGIATSLVSGPLHSTPAHLAKVSTSSESESSNAQHLICIMKVLLRNHGVNLSGVKSDLYTVIGIDSKHPSGIPSTVWKNTAVLPDKEIKELKDAFFAKKKPAANETKVPEASSSADKPDAVPADAPKARSKPKLKKKTNDDPFASDDEGDAKPKAKAVPKAKAGASSKTAGKQFSGSEDDEPKTKPAPKAKRAKKADDGDDDDDEEERPKKKRVVKK
ncbi:hypothetical protein NLJ89_g6744 [Agrocybe chaxingu]|uniref:Uncharacterized protein n=1 Tax=Agrocybe chaxingu TaxID=84603 RepID=A0A9W8JYN1_9AGAR|nr:hypothetical protein NLJ89_g6744 [Agrocybe chaxingu]